MRGLLVCSCASFVADAVRLACPPDPALGASVEFDFTQGASSMWTPTGGTPTYDSTGVSFSVSSTEKAPQLNSNFFIMFGKVEVTMQVAPGAGVCSAFVMQSDCLDELDWEFTLSAPGQGQMNYFRKQQEGSDTNTPTAGALTGLHTYGYHWTSTQIDWTFDGNVVRTLTAAAAGASYPQTPMQIKIGAWAPGDPSNAPGTICESPDVGRVCRPC